MQVGASPDWNTALRRFRAEEAACTASHEALGLAGWDLEYCCVSFVLERFAQCVTLALR